MESEKKTAAENTETVQFQTEKLTVGYDGKPIVRDVTLSLPRGNVLTLIGPNGAGKSTILKSIAGQLAILEGTVYLGEKELSSCNVAERAKYMAVLLTGNVHTELMTCRDVVEAGRYPYTGRLGKLSARDHAAACEAMKLVQVENLADQSFQKISDGQRQRVLLAKAICQEPEILILDEPTSYLDIRYKVEFLSALLKWKEEKGVTVIMSLHELELAKAVSDFILCVNCGCMEKYAPPDEVFTKAYLTQLFHMEKGEKNPLQEQLLSAVCTS